MAIASRSSTPATQQVVLEGVTWETYQRLLHELGNHRATRLAYDQGMLEIIMPSDLHELITRLLEAMVRVLTEELNLPIRGYGSTTLDREDLAQGVEPDACFYIQNFERVQGKGLAERSQTPLNVSTDPPPDLVIEVDISRSSQRRLGIYRQLCIPEVWRYTRQDGLTFYQLQGDQYGECEFSPTFPMVSSVILGQFLQQSDHQDDNSVMRALRQWIRSQPRD